MLDSEVDILSKDVISWTPTYEKYTSIRLITDFTLLQAEADVIQDYYEIFTKLLP